MGVVEAREVMAMATEGMTTEGMATEETKMVTEAAEILTGTEMAIGFIGME
jgi:hypothetical protein